jgi:Zn-dependent peptidase ImmA (M78 family)/transcriptional regulator with XRE-family HTH domain
VAQAVQILIPRERFWGARLQLVREYAGLTQKELALNVGVSSALISDLENDKRLWPGVELARALGVVLQVKAEFFFSKVDDPFLEAECNFRHRRTTPEKIKNRVRAHAALLGMIVEELRKIFGFPKLTLPTAYASSGDEIEAAAQLCRKTWNVDLHAPFLQLGRAVERAGVVIVAGLVDTRKVDAFSRYGEESLIFLNEGAGTGASRRNFDIAHEIGHLVMHKNMLTGDIETETAADRFASALLMPRPTFEREFNTRPYSLDHVLNLKKRWNTSAAAITRRALDLQLIDAITYRRANQQMSARGWKRYEPNEPPMYRPELLATALSSLGKSVKTDAKAIQEKLGITNELYNQVLSAHS